MIIEVWDKKTSAHDDQLVGIVKLPLHQFYMSYRDRRISNALLKSQYPVMSVDNDLPVVNPLTGVQQGRIRILLAMGSVEQVIGLQRTRLGLEPAVGGVAQRPTHHLERSQLNGDHGGMSEHVDCSIEHIFEVVIVGISGLRLLENMIWGEADCFVQYHFPSQSSSQVRVSHLWILFQEWRAR